MFYTFRNIYKHHFWTNWHPYGGEYWRNFGGIFFSLPSSPGLTSSRFPPMYGTVGLIVLPLMIFHQIQLILCSWLATRYGREADAATVS